jgi:uncharacterized protein (TIGR03435 family)
VTSFGSVFSAALVDFIWEGTAIGLALWLTRGLLRRRSPRARYLVSCLALGVLAVVPFLTMAALRSSAVVAPAAVAATAPNDVTPALPQTLLTFWLEPANPRLHWLAIVQQWALPIWSIGVLLLSLRLALAYSRTRSLTRRTESAHEDLRVLLSQLASRIGIARPVRLAMSSLSEGPSVIGWLRPVILLPPATIMGLTPQQLEAVLAHELAHIRRHDYAVNLLQIVVETLFFYHPVVWWVSQQIRDERELCCDDVVVRTCGNPVEYARALATLARRQIEMPAFASAATGGPLLHRVRRLVGLQHTEYRSPHAVAVLTASLALTAVVVNLDWLQAQTVESSGVLPRFEVASVKRNNVDDGRIMNSYRNGRLTASGFTVAGLIRSAYQVQEFQIVGGPEWINHDRFDIVANASREDADARNVPGEPPRQVLMLRSLLGDRFKLQVHKETRDMPVYAIVLARKDGSLGAKLRRSSVDCDAVNAARLRGDAPPPPSDDLMPCSTSVGPGRLTARSRTMPQIATSLSMLTSTGSSLNRLIVDRSGLQGSFDADLTFTPDNLPNFGPGGPPPGMPAIDPNGPSIFTAIQEQLGLKLDPQRGPVEVLVIDRVDPPAED